MFFERAVNGAIKCVNIMTNKYFYHECFLPVLFGLINVTYSAG
ncbi:putative membrane protein [Escherichia coli PA5]|nr:putative membrane protein [Escherichia coli PA5]EKJ53636.1 putative membrane protein [Escherichia coli FRIK523]EKW46625.1 putative membrane protein [Escherichia coli 96.0427]EKW57432.1 putative membrane protein [Escherichia coli 96.0932]ERC68313.1 putative membrane protein [Escherichia coli Bd5610_99]